MFSRIYARTLWAVILWAWISLSLISVYLQQTRSLTRSLEAHFEVRCPLLPRSSFCFGLLFLWPGGEPLCGVTHLWVSKVVICRGLWACDGYVCTAKWCLAFCIYVLLINSYLHSFIACIVFWTPEFNSQLLYWGLYYFYYWWSMSFVFCDYFFSSRIILLLIYIGFIMLCFLCLLFSTVLSLYGYISVDSCYVYIYVWFEIFLKWCMNLAG